MVALAAIFTRQRTALVALLAASVIAIVLRSSGGPGRSTQGSIEVCHTRSSAKKPLGFVFFNDDLLEKRRSVFSSQLVDEVVASRILR